MEMISAEALAYDLHTHSTFSDGNNAPVHMAKVVSSYGMKGVIIADHIFSEKDADELLEKQRGVVFPETDCKFRFGAEIAMKDVDGTPAATPEQQKNFKFLLLTLLKFLEIKLKQFTLRISKAKILAEISMVSAITCLTEMLISMQLKRHWWQ